jgi:hypothetical protein
MDCAGEPLAESYALPNSLPVCYLYHRCSNTPIQPVFPANLYSLPQRSISGIERWTRLAPAPCIKSADLFEIRLVAVPGIAR